MIAISEDVRESISSLDKREKRFAEQVKYAAWVLGVLVVGALGASLIASFLGVSEHLSSIDIPGNVLRDLIGQPNTKGRFNTLSAFDNASRQLTSLLSLSSLLPFLFIIFGFVLRFLTDSPDGIYVSLFGVMLFIVIFLSSVPNYLKSNESSRGSYLQLKQTSSEHEFEAAFKFMNGMNQTQEGIYVLAQMSIIEGKNRIPITDEIVNKILLPSDDFTPQDKALYFIERAAYGEPRSELAKAYRESAESRQKKAQWFATLLGGMSAAAAGLIVVLSLIRYSIASRIQRIWNLLGTTPDKDEELQAAR